MRRTILGAAVLAGVVAGAAGAALSPAHPARATTAAAPAAQAATVPVSDPAEQGRLPDGRYDPGRVQYVAHAARIVATLPDPDGGPAWALKVFDAERVTLKRPAPTLAGARVIGREHCVQLGRVRDGKFGWVYGDGRFLVNRIEDRLLQCANRKRPTATAMFALALRIADPAAPALARSVVWGLAPGATTATVSGTGSADGAATVAGGAYLRLGGADAATTPDAAVTVGAKRVALAPRDEIPNLVHLHFPTPIAGSERIEARAPDPSGGPGYGMLVAATQEGTPCVTGPVQVVGGRAGDADLRLAMFWETLLGPGSCRPTSTAPSAARACDIGYGFGDEETGSADAFLARARVQRRLLPGRTSIYAQCSADVDRVTLRTPRDVRTLVPSAVGHAVLAVYDGDFPAGTAEFIAHLRNGTTQTQPLQLGF